MSESDLGYPSVEELFKDAGEDEKPSCNCCGSEGVPLEVFRRYGISGKQRKGNDRFAALCQICANTHIGSVYEFPDRESTHDILKTIAFVGNEILKQIRK
jgi:hypothetical protein